MVETLAFAVGAYLIGAIPFGLLVGLWRGVDIREHGSRNIGATNAGRVLGRSWGLLCLALDMLKGFLPVLAANLALAGEASSLRLLQVLGVAVAAVLGHVFPVYLRFRGGKGVATTIGVALGIYPYYTVAMAVALGCYGLVRWTTGLVSLGSLVIAVTFPVSLYLYLRHLGKHLSDFWPLVAVAVLLGALIVVRHRTNIARLLRGEEMRVNTRVAGAARSRREGSA
jgi:glycerol-3-phosphate acyltransferase PlsY